MVCVLAAMQLCCNIGLLACCSRITWAFARDQGMPGHQYVSKVRKNLHLPLKDLRPIAKRLQIHAKTSIPLFAVVSSATLSFLLSFLVLASSTTFTNITTISAAGLCLSYLLATILLFWRRVTGKISHASLSEYHLTNTPGFELSWGPWRLPGLLGPAVNLIAIVYLSIICFFSFWPAQATVNASNMNYCIVVTGAAVAWSVIWYVWRGRRIYKGPIVNALDGH